jgi:hypothetical protein
MPVKAEINTIRSSHPQKEVGEQMHYAQRKTFQTSEPLKPVGDQARYSAAFRALKQIDEKSAIS